MLFRFSTTIFYSRQGRNCLKLKNHATTIFIVFLIPLSAFSQRVDIRGVVSDSATGERIPYANVLIPSLSKGAAANLSGFYLIPSLPEGTYEIVASAVGYERQAKTVTLRGTAPITVNFRLPSKAVELGEVVVSERAKPAMLEIQTSVHIVDKADIKMVPVSTQGDVLRSIQILPGIVSTSDVNAQFYVRGGASDQNLILLDGMRIYNPFHAFGLFSVFDPDIIRTTEVYTGAFPPEFGGRLSSVINIASRDGNASKYSASANLNFLSSKVQLEGPISESIQSIFTARKSMFSTTFKNFLLETVPLSFYDALLKLSFKNPSDQNRYTVQAFISQDNLTSSDPYEPDYSWSSRAFGLEAYLLSTDRLFWNVVVSAGMFEQKRDPKFSESAKPATNIVKEAGLRANVTYYTDSKDLYFFGFELNFPSTSYDLTNRLGLPAHLKGSIPEVSLWLHYQKQWGLFRTDLGARAEIGTLFRGRSVKSSLQPRLNLSMDLLGNWKAKAAFGRFSQDVITVTNEDDIIPIFTPWIAVPSNLEPEQADHYVLGLDGNLVEHLSLNVQAYYKHYSSLITYNRDKIDNRDPDYTNAKGKSYGGEALVRFAHPWVDLYAAYTLTWVRIDLNGFIYSPRYDRRHTLNLLASLHIMKDLDLSARWEFGSGLPFTQSIGFYDRLTLGNGYPDPFVTETGKPITLYGPKNAARLPTYHRMDINLSYHAELFSFVRASMGFNLINAYDRKNIFYFDRESGKRYDMLGFFPSANLTLEFLR